MLWPAAAILLFIYILKSVNIIFLMSIRSIVPIKIVSPTIFILSVCFAIAFPIYYRITFVNKVKDKKSVSPELFIYFEKKFLYLVMVTPYLAVLAYLFQLPKFHFAGTILCTFYAVYYYFPSKRRMRFEQKLFRVKPTCIGAKTGQK